VGRCARGSESRVRVVVRLGGEAIPWDIAAVHRKDSLRKNVTWRRLSIASLLGAGILLPALASISVAQPAGDTPAASAKLVPVPAPKTTTVWLNPSAMPPPVTIVRTPPDPPPLVQKEQWVYDLRYAGGELFLLGIHPIELTAPQVTPRAMGRFALELYEGPILIERVRFDFPMLGDVILAVSDAGSERSIRGPAPSFAKKLVTRIGVMFPGSKRGTQLVIVDRATQTRWPLPWPPVEMTSSAPSVEGSSGDAGSSD
jgi:hypothetical protein